MNPELRAEVERLLRAGGDGLSHGAVFCLREEGLSIEQIASKRGVTAAEIKTWIASLDHLFAGTIPTSKKGADRNSYVYRYLLWCVPSANLLSSAKARLRDLQAVNPKVSMAPMPPRSYQHGKGKPPREVTREVQCAECGMLHAGECL